MALVVTIFSVTENQELVVGGVITHISALVARTEAHPVSLKVAEVWRVNALFARFAQAILVAQF